MAKKKSKYPADREMQSESFKNNRIEVSVYKTSPQMEIKIKEGLNEDVQNDIKSAIDEILKFHGH